jgi:hypothetical protein
MMKNQAVGNSFPSVKRGTDVRFRNTRPQLERNDVAKTQRQDFWESSHF